MIRTYETIFIIRPDLTGEAYTAVVDKFKGVLAEQGASIIKCDEWGVRKLAYPIRKNGRGQYVLVIFDGKPSMITEFERRMRIDEAILKFQTVHLEKGYVAAPVAPVVAAPVEAEAEAAAETVEENA